MTINAYGPPQNGISFNDRLDRQNALQNETVTTSLLSEKLIESLNNNNPLHKFILKEFPRTSHYLYSKGEIHMITSALTANKEAIIDKALLIGVWGKTRLERMRNNPFGLPGPEASLLEDYDAEYKFSWLVSITFDNLQELTSHES